MNKETLEEVAESKYGTDMDSHRGGPVYDLNADSKRAFVKGAMWMQERMYSEEDLKQFAAWLIKINFNYTSNITKILLIWKEQFKKK